MKIIVVMFIKKYAKKYKVLLNSVSCQYTINWW
jgi:hypothetical protein